MENENQGFTQVSQSSGHYSVQPPKTRKGTLVLIAVISFAIGLGLSWYIFGRGDLGQNGAPAISDVTTSSYVKISDNEKVQAVATIGGNSISVKNQISGNQVVLESVSFESDGWVAIHEERDGELGNTLGAGWFPAGTNSGTIDLLRGTVAGGTYYAVLHGDDGDKQYNYKIDKPLTDDSGSMLMVKFSAE